METWFVQPEQVSFGDSPCLSFPLATETTAKSAGQAPLPFIRGKINLSLMCFGFQSKSGHREFCSWCWPWNGTRGCPWAHLGLGSWKVSRSRRVSYSHLQPALLPFVLPSKSLLLLAERSFCSSFCPNKIQIRVLGTHKGCFGVNSDQGIQITLISSLPWAPVVGTDPPLSILQAVFIYKASYKDTLLLGRQDRGCHSGDVCFF